MDPVDGFAGRVFCAMSKHSRYERALSEMYGLRRFGIKLELSTMSRILQNLGNPHLKFESIHISGTNGKGSIAVMLSSILQLAGYKTGLYTSPHLVTFNERIKINNRQVSNADVVRAYEAIKGLHGDARQPTFFEYTTAMAFHLFAEKKVDVAVIETGMGGRFDATNIIKPRVSIISNVSLEHRSYLGSTLSKIAFEKAGIIKAGVPVVTGARQKSVLTVIENTAKQRKAALFRIGRDFRVVRRQSGARFSYYGIDRRWKDLRTGLAGAFQVENAALAMAACELLIDSGMTIGQEAVREGLAAARWPARLETVSESPLILIDGAHNLAAARRLAAYLAENLYDRKITLVTGILDDKPYRAILKTLVPMCDNVIVTRARIDRSIPPEILAKEVQMLGAPAVVAGSVKEALALAKNRLPSRDGAICVAGSLYVAGEARHAIVKNGVMQPAI